MTADHVVIVSGGMDSVTCATLASEQTDNLLLLSFDYGQRHLRELAFARKCADRLGVEHRVLHLPDLGSSALTDPKVDVPDGHYAEESMRQTVVPNRNAIMLSVAWGIAVAEEAQALWAGMHAGDHFIYPDCRPAFVYALNAALRIATDGFADDDLELRTPFLHSTKADIVATGARLGVPWDQTWSCYKGGEHHCGACGTCFERREAFRLAGVGDPTEYEALPEYAAP